MDDIKHQQPMAFLWFSYKVVPPSYKLVHSTSPNYSSFNHHNPNNECPKLDILNILNQLS